MTPQGRSLWWQILDGLGELFAGAVALIIMLGFLFLVAEYGGPLGW